MESIFLTEAEVEKLTGWKQPKKQAEHCRMLGIPFFPNKRGFPVIAREALTGKPSSTAKDKKTEWQPSKGK